MRELYYLALKILPPPFVAGFFVQLPPPPKKCRLSRVSQIAAEMFDQPVDTKKKKFGLGLYTHNLLSIFKILDPPMVGLIASRNQKQPTSKSS